MLYLSFLYNGIQMGMMKRGLVAAVGWGQKHGEEGSQRINSVGSPPSFIHQLCTCHWWIMGHSLCAIVGESLKGLKESVLSPCLNDHTDHTLHTHNCTCNGPVTICFFVFKQVIIRKQQRWLALPWILNTVLAWVECIIYMWRAYR